MNQSNRIEIGCINKQKTCQGSKSYSRHSRFTINLNYKRRINYNKNHKTENSAFSDVCSNVI